MFVPTLSRSRWNFGGDVPPDSSVSDFISVGTILVSVGSLGPGRVRTRRRVAAGHGRRARPRMGNPASTPIDRDSHFPSSRAFLDSTDSFYDRKEPHCHEAHFPQRPRCLAHRPPHDGEYKGTLRDLVKVVTSQQPGDVRTGLAWLREADPVLARVIDEHPAFDPTAWMRRLPTLDLFGALVFQVVGQQISVVAARAIFARVLGRFGGRAPDPTDLVALDPQTLRELGLSRQKANTVLDLAQRFTDNRLSEVELRNLPDEEAIRQLTAVKGVGPWTAKGALLIALHRPDLVRTEDIALRHAIQLHYGLPHLPDQDEVAALARRWSPYGSLASSLLLATARAK